MMDNHQLTALLVVFTIFLVNIPATASAAQEMTLMEDNSKQVTFNVGDTFKVLLRLTGGSGYSWKLSLSDGLTLLSTKTYSGPHKPGTTQAQEFRIKAVDIGSQKINGVYKRPWEKTSKYGKTFSVKIDVI